MQLVIMTFDRLIMGDHFSGPVIFSNISCYLSQFFSFNIVQHIEEIVIYHTNIHCLYLFQKLSIYIY